jgi:hypothetical protein
VNENRAANVGSAQVKNVDSSKNESAIIPSDKMNGNLSKIIGDIKNYTKNKNSDYASNDFKSKFRYLNEVKNCAFNMAAEGGATGISQKLMDQFADDAKPWNELSDSEKQVAMNIILPEIWVPTLIHEMGHNLGLRHNFEGSEDKANFYSNEELAAFKIDHKIPFTSVMEYGDDLKALPVLGKYDIAALKFGYNREVEVVSNGVVSTVKVNNTLGDLQLAKDQQLKKYGYCTDEHTGTNPGCKRFDLGTTYTEITQNTIQSYEDLYAQRNFRNGRANMSLMDDIGYAQRISGIFRELRIMMEVRERIKYKYGIPDGHPVWTTNEFLKDLNDASVMAGQHMTKVLMTPDATCAVSMKNKPGSVVGTFNLSVLDSDAISCFSADLTNGNLYQYADQIMVVAQTGKMFNAKKDPRSTNSYIDQIDVRGYWIDKAMAIKTLFNRNTGIYNFDKNNDTFINLPDVGEPLLKSALAIIDDNIVDNLEYTTIDGSKAILETAYDLSNSQIVDKNLITSSVPENMANRIASFFLINANGSTKLQQMVSEVVAKNAKDKTGANPNDIYIGKTFSVYRATEINELPQIDGALQLQIGVDVYFATARNTVAKNMITNSKLASTLESLKVLDAKGQPTAQVDIKNIEKILAAKVKGEVMPETATAEEKAVWGLDAQNIENYINGVLKSSAYYTGVLEVLPRDY